MRLQVFVVGAPWRGEAEEDERRRWVRDVDACTSHGAPCEGTECPICLEAGASVPAWRTTRCGHSFCEPCARRWFAGSVRCPCCNREVCEPHEQDQSPAPDGAAGPGEPELQLLRAGLRQMWLAAELYHHLSCIGALLGR